MLIQCFLEGNFRTRYFELLAGLATAHLLEPLLLYFAVKRRSWEWEALRLNQSVTDLLGLN